MRKDTEGRCLTHDGEQLFYRHWPAASGRPEGTILLFHRGHEHSGRMAHLVEELNLPDYEFFAWDARGHGRSTGRRGYVQNIGVPVRDIQTFVRHLETVHGVKLEKTALIGQSVGAVLAAAWVHDYAPGIRAMVLAAPAFRIKLYVPFAKSLLKLAKAFRGDFFINSYVKARWLTHDVDRRESYDKDPLIVRDIGVGYLLGLFGLSDRLVADAPAIGAPTLILISGADRVVSRAPQETFFERLGAADKECHVFDGFYHDTLGEKDRQEAVSLVRAFILHQFAGPFERPSLLNADEEGFTKAEADSLAAALPGYSPRAIYWALYRLGLRIGGLLSEGIRMGHQTGFDSGSTLDYVYRNKPQGRGPVGRLVDGAYLASVGWRGIRRRKQNAEEMIGRAMQELSDSGMPVRIVDIAAGHGRYVLDAIEKAGVRPASVLLRDYSDLNIEAGADLIKRKGMEDIAQFKQGDAFDRDDLASIEPGPTLGVVSGLYELFADNGLVRGSLDGLSAAMEDGGYLVYTGQPWHPQLEMIARALTSHRQGQAWIMRRRTQAEMDQLVEAAGFTKIDQLVDEWGIFTVSLARKRSAP